MCLEVCRQGCPQSKGHFWASSALQEVPALPPLHILARSWHSLIPTQNKPCTGTWCYASSFRDRVKYKDSQ